MKHALLHINAKSVQIVKRATLISCTFLFFSCNSIKIAESEVGLGWSSNSVNTVIFRSDAVTSFQDYQFTAYYDPEGHLVLAKRKLNEDSWQTLVTQYKGNVKDAHNSISLAVDGEGFLHLSWDQHNTRLRYTKSLKPLSLELGDELTMTGQQEERVTYPEFHNLPNGNLLFFYRSGESGRGNMVINLYDVKTSAWIQVQNNLLDGKNTSSAYWQATVDRNGSIYLSWVWRETWDVETNHDMCYAVSHDNGKTWEKSTGVKYVLPITQESAEVVWEIPQNSSLINQTSMTVDEEGNPYIATYWDNNGIPQYKVVYLKNGVWKLLNTDFHKKPFQLGGGGTKSIPFSRPEILTSDSMVYLLFRDEERHNKITLAYTNTDHVAWKLMDIGNNSVGQWEPNFDKALWNKQKTLHIFSQHVIQVDGEGLATREPQPVYIIQIKNLPKHK